MISHGLRLAAIGLAFGVADGSVDLVTAAQAAHWFNRPVFFAEAPLFAWAFFAREDGFAASSSFQ